LAGITVGFGFVFLMFSGQAFSAGIPITLTTSPITLDLHILPGTSQTETLEFKNSSPIALPVTMQVQVFGAYGSTGQAAISEPKPGDTSTSWVSFSPSSFTAQPNVWTSVKMTIALPKSASLGYYYAIIFKPTIPSSTAAHTTNIKGSNAILVLVDSATSNEQKQISVTNFSVTKHIYEYLPVDFSVTLHNGGNIYLPPSGDIFISRNANMSHTIATIPFNNAGANVLPQSNRIFTSSWTDGFPVFEPKLLNGEPEQDAQNQTIYALKWDFSKANEFRFGKYYAQLALTYNDGISNKLVISQVSFWVIPWFILLIACIVLVLIAIGLWTVGRTAYKRTQRRKRSKQ
jgi:hypothetical protein